MLHTVVSSDLCRQLQPVAVCNGRMRRQQADVDVSALSAALAMAAWGPQQLWCGASRPCALTIRETLSEPFTLSLTVPWITAYVVMLAGANSIGDNNTPVGLVYFCGVLPTLFVKLSVPYWCGPPCGKRCYEAICFAPPGRLCTADRWRIQPAGCRCAGLIWFPNGRGCATCQLCPAHVEHAERCAIEMEHRLLTTGLG